MEFEAFLEGKNIDPVSFKKGDAEQYHTWEHLYSQMSVESFTQQQLFLINGIRRQYTMSEPAEEKPITAPAKSTKTVQPKPNLISKKTE